MKKYIRLLPILIIVFTVGFVGYSRVNVDAEDGNVIPNTVYVGDINVSGMTVEEATDAVTAYVSELQEVQFSLVAGENSIEVSGEELGIEAGNLEVIEEALHLGKTGNLIARYKDKKDLEKEPKQFDLIFKTDAFKVAEFLETNLETLNQEAVNSGLKREDGEFVIVEGTNGIEVNVEESVNCIQNHIAQDWNEQDNTIELATETIEPKGTPEELAKVKDVLGSYNTDYRTSAAGRAKNVENGASRINGTVVYPGEQFSVYEMVAPFDAEHGYELAGSYENGTTVQTYGGGICQVSTTLYNAVILAELQIDERYNHSMIVTYVKPSMDAAIAGTAKDFKFTNNTDAPIYIEGYTSSRKVYFNIYGQETRPENRKVSYVSEILSQTEAGVTIQADGTQPIGYINQLQSAHTGYTAKLWKVVTVDGVEESRTEFNSSRYNPSNKVLAVGVASENPDAAAHIHSAIATGDELTVKMVAAQYRGDAAAMQAAQAAMDARNAQAAQAAAQAQQEALQPAPEAQSQPESEPGI